MWFKKVRADWAPVPFSLLFIAMGLGMSLTTYDVIKNESNGEKWITAPATITYSYSIQLPGGRYSTPSFHYNFYYRASYNFVAFNGKTYSAERAGSSQPVSSKMLDQPSVVDGVIYYDPNNPNASDVERPGSVSDPATPIFFGFLAIVFTLLGIRLLYDDLKRLKILPNPRRDLHNPPTHSHR
jgi:Protein of unknown function (DUF3592)